MTSGTRPEGAVPAGNGATVSRVMFRHITRRGAGGGGDMGVGGGMSIVEGAGRVSGGGKGPGRRPHWDTTRMYYSTSDFGTCIQKYVIERYVCLIVFMVIAQTHVQAVATVH